MQSCGPPGIEFETTTVNALGNAYVQYFVIPIKRIKTESFKLKITRNN